jgi:ABC-2 type transport system permease protein
MRTFARASLQEELAFRLNFAIEVLQSALGLGTGILGLSILYGQVESIRGWGYAQALALLGVYLLLGALRRLVIGPSLDALAGLGGTVWTGQFDFSLLRPLDTQFLSSVQRWRFGALLDVVLALLVLARAIQQLGANLAPGHVVAFVLALIAGLAALYAVLLLLSALIFWSPGFLHTWLFSGLWQMARYPVGIYPGWVRLVLTWVVPVGLMTTVPAQALTGDLSLAALAGTVAAAAALVLGASWIFRRGLRRYASASS